MFLWSRCPFYVVAHYKMPVSVYAFVILFVSTTAWMCVCLCAQRQARGDGQRC